jgi:DNA-binding NarL/FixJ family response regulator
MVGVVGTDELRVAGLRALLEDDGRFRVGLVGEPKALDQANLEVVIVDAGATLHLFELLAEFRRLRPLLRVLVLGSETDLEYVERVIAAGARGYLSHKASANELVMAVEVVRDNSVWAPRKVLARLLDRVQPPAVRTEAAEEIHFTPRELEVLQLLVLGHPNRGIAQALSIDEGTVKAHLARLMRKAGVLNRTALTIRALERGWI